MLLPYGISSFAELRRGGYAFADKTRFIRDLESAEKGRHYLVFVRPRRMGKTLLVSMLEHYYDILHAPSFDELFGGLAIASAPTPEKGRYAVLRLEMTGLPTSGGVDLLRSAFHDRLHNKIHEFLERYAAVLPEVIARLDEADGQLRRYLADPKLAAIAPRKGWKAVSVAFVATEACWLRELGGEAKNLAE